MQSLAERLAALTPAQRAETLAGLSESEAEELLYDWSFWARPSQLAPAGDWSTWLILAGRGFGKTRTGAEWVRDQVTHGGLKRVGLVAPTAADARKVMVEGESGILAISAPSFRPLYQPSQRQLTWPNGAIATLYSAEEPERLRGPQHDGAWCDELCAWKYGGDTWDMLQFGLRLGARPRQIVTTTPRPIKLLKDIIADAGTVTTRGGTRENAANLAPAFLRVIVNKYEGTRLGRQELDGEVLEEVIGALWSRAKIEALRVRPADVPQFTRIVVAIDPAVSSGEDANETGIVAAALGADGHAYVLDDISGVRRPGGADGWAAEAIALYRARKADRIIGEVNNGGEMIESTLRVIDPAVPYKAVHATRGKVRRAEPISALYEQGLVHHVGAFPQLEDQMCAFTTDFDVGAAGYSPDRMDALVWALTELCVHDGIQVIGAAEREVACEAIAIAPTWPRVYALALSADRVGVVWGAHDKEADTLYLYAEHSAPRGDLAVHAAAIRDRLKWVPGVFAPRASERDKIEGARVYERLEALELQLTAVDDKPDAAVEAMKQRVDAGRLKIFRSLTGLMSEYRALRRDAKGNLTEGAELMNAAALLCATGVDVALTEPKKARHRGDSTRSAWGA